ncbi:MAG: PKD domain-containing protein [Planctomycetaceae bacterium]
MLFHSLRQLVSRSLGNSRSRCSSSRSSNSWRRTSIQSGLESLEPRALLSSVSVSGNSLSFVADAGEMNTVTISESGGVITIIDTTSVITPGAGVTSVNSNEVTIPVTGLVVIGVNLGDLDDVLDMSAVSQVGSLRRTSLSGGDGNDTIIGSDLNDSFTESPGSDSIDGRGAIDVDQWLVNSDFDMTMTDAGLMIGTDFDTFANIEFVSLGGLSGDNIIDASAVTAASGITNGMYMNGRDGNDTLIGAAGVRNNFQDFVGNNSFVGGALLDSVPAFQDEDMILTDFTFTVGTSVNTHVGIESFDMRGGVSGNVIDASAITAAGDVTTVQIIGGPGDDLLRGSYLNDIIRDTGGSNVLDGLGGTDILIVFGDTDQVLTNSTLSLDGVVSTHANFEDVRLQGGAGDNTLDSSAVTAASGINVVFLTGLAGNDVLLGGELNEVFADNDGNNTIDAGGGFDRFTATGDVDMTAIDGTLFVGPYVNTISNVEDLRMTGGAGANVIDSSALTAASGVTLNVISSLGGNDTIRPSGDTGINSNLNGGDGAASGIDTLDLSRFPVTPNVNIAGPGTSDGSRGNVGSNISFNNMNLFTLPPEYDFMAATYAVVEGDSPNTTNVVQVTRSVNTTIASSVDVVLTGGTAVAGDDFTVGPITVNFLPGEVTKFVPIELLGDSDIEADETVLLSFTNGISGAANATAVLTILNDDDEINTAPEIITVTTDATMADKALPGETVALTATFTDSDAGDTHSATIDWGDGTTSAGAVNQLTGVVTGNHQYSTGGLFRVTVQITDLADQSDSGSTTSIVTGVRVTADGVLEIIGTSGKDIVNVQETGRRRRRNSDSVQVVANFDVQRGHGGSDGGSDGGRDRGAEVFRFDADSVTSIHIVLCEGDDQATIGSGGSDGGSDCGSDGGSDRDLDIPALIEGGGGDDRLTGGRAADILIGGLGNDRISGGSGDDIILGGDGKDDLRGGNGNDLMVSDAWAYDAVLDALDAVHQEWTDGSLTYEQKRDHLTGTTAGGHNGAYLFNSMTLATDGERDTIRGDRGRDLFFAFSHDRVKDKKHDEDLFANG